MRAARGYDNTPFGNSSERGVSYVALCVRLGARRAGRYRNINCTSMYMGSSIMSENFTM